MKLYNDVFKQIMKGYKAVKTVCKSATLTLYGGESVIQFEDSTKNEIVELSYLSNGNDDDPVLIDDGTLKLMEKCKEDFEITMEECAGSVKAGTKTITYVCENTPKNLIDYSQFASMCEISQAELLDCIKSVKFSTSQDGSRPVLRNILWEDNNFVSVDGYRVTTKQTNVTPQMPLLLIPTAFNLLEKLLDKKSQEPVKVFLDMDHSDKRYIAFKFGDWTLITYVGAGEFLTYKQMMDTSEHKLKLIVNRKELQEKLEFLQQDKSPLIIENLQDKLLLTTETATNRLEDSVDVEIDYCKNCDGFKIAFNPKYLIQSLKNGIGEKIELSFAGTSLAPLVITYDNGKDLILPVRING